MSIPHQSERLKKVHARALERIDREMTALRDERIQCLDDRRFYGIAGAQWEGQLGVQFENKPRFEMNKTHLAVIRVINEYRNNRIAVEFSSKDGSENDQMADTCNGLYRADDQDSGGQEAFDNGFEEGVGGGFGAWRLRAAYEDEYDEQNTKQRIRREPITDADTCVFFDGNAKRQDKSDARWAVVLTGFTYDAYEDAYGESPVDWPEQITRREFDWCTPDMVYVAEYYEVEEKTELVHFYRGIALNPDEPNEIRLTDDELTDEKKDELQATGFRLARQKRIKYCAVHKYQLSGNGVLEDEGVIAGKMIPIIPVYGKRWVVDGVERCMGHVRLAKDAQRLVNMLMSWLAEMAARFDYEKPIVTPEQIAGHAHMWAVDNTEKFPYLLLNPVTDPATSQAMASGPIGYTKAPNIPPAMAALMQIAEQSLSDLLGNQQAGEQVQSNVSGKVIELVQNRLDMQAFIYMSNMAKAVKRDGEVWLSMAKDLYVEQGRKMKTIAKDGATAGSVELARPIYDEESGKTKTENDFTEANFDVNVDVGPSSTSRRQSTVRALSALLQTVQDPETRTVLESMIMLNMEGEGLQDVRGYFRNKLVRLGVVKPTDKEAEAIKAEQEAAASAPPDANTQFLQASAEKAMADALLQQAKTGESHAKTIETLAGVESSQLADAITFAEAISPAPVVDQQAPTVTDSQGPTPDQ